MHRHIRSHSRWRRTLWFIEGFVYLCSSSRSMDKCRCVRWRARGTQHIHTIHSQGKWHSTRRRKISFLHINNIETDSIDICVVGCSMARTPSSTTSIHFSLFLFVCLCSRARGVLFMPTRNAKKKRERTVSGSISYSQSLDILHLSLTLSLAYSVAHVCCSWRCI